MKDLVTETMTLIKRYEQHLRNLKRMQRLATSTGQRTPCLPQRPAKHLGAGPVATACTSGLWQ